MGGYRGCPVIWRAVNGTLLYFEITAKNEYCVIFCCFQQFLVLQMIPRGLQHQQVRERRSCNNNLWQANDIVMVFYYFTHEYKVIGTRTHYIYSYECFLRISNKSVIEIFCQVRNKVSWLGYFLLCRQSNVKKNKNILRDLSKVFDEQRIYTKEINLNKAN